MNDPYKLNRFVAAQTTSYAQALTEVTKGRKTSHWMWYVFPQFRGLGYSETAKFYAIQSRDEAEAYLRHSTLGPRLVDISTALLAVSGKTANQIFGSPDDLKLHSSMTLFCVVADDKPVFQQVIDQYFGGKPDGRTVRLLDE